MKKILLAFFISAITTISFAKDCPVEVTGNDLMQFNVKEITFPKTCDNLVVTLKHVGKSQKTVMGHNFIVADTKDVTTIINEGLKAGINNDYIESSDKKILAHTKLVGGGETDKVKISKAALKPGSDYSFFCSFPGHIAMKGKLTVQ